MTAKSPTQRACRLCNGETTEIFQLKILDKYPVGYLKCRSCGSLQTEEPFWLDEAYRENLAFLDTGAAQRNLNNLAAGYFVSLVYGCRDVLDYGGGDGLLCRLLRDHGLNAYVSDKYGSSTYALSFTKPDFLKPQLILCFEVFEHFTKPKEDLERIFSMQPEVLFSSTEPFNDHHKRWWYLAPETGQHVFFYSRPALQEIAASFGYQLTSVGAYHVFVRNALNRKYRSFMLRRFLAGGMLRTLRILMSLMPARGYEADFLKLKSPPD